MNLILYPDTETDFESNGLGILSDALSAKVVRELNGQYELSMTYPCTGIHAEHLTGRNIITAKPDPVAAPQPFRIYRVNPVSSGTITVYARHIAYDTMGIPCAPFTASSCADAMASLKPNAVTDCPFSFSTDKSTEGALSVDVPKAIWNILGGTEGSILDRYGGEYEFDRFRITLRTRLGEDRGVSIRYGKNLTTLEQDRNCASVYTGAYPYWKSSEGELVTLPERTLDASGDYNFVRILPLDLSEKFESAPTEEQLRSAAVKYMDSNHIGVPDVSWTVQFVQLEQTEEYKGIAILERVLLGDTVSVVFPSMNVNASARAVKIDYDPILERYNSVTLGKVKSNLASTIVNQKKELEKELEKKAGSSALRRAMDAATKAILGARGGSVRVLDTDSDGKMDTLYIADHEDPNEATKVWRYNYEGWAASENGYNGPFKMAATLEHGILAEAVTAAHLTAGTIGSLDGPLFIDLDNGIFRSQAVIDVETAASAAAEAAAAAQTAADDAAKTAAEAEQKAKAAKDAADQAAADAAAAEENAAADAAEKAEAAKAAAIEAAAAQSAADAAAAEAAAKAAAAAEAKSYVDGKLESYSTSAQIKVLTDAIEAEVSKKLNTSDLSTKIRQDATSVQIAWNNIDYRIKFENGELRIYDGTYKVAAYTMTGAKYFNGGYHVGTIGANYSLSGNTDLKGLSFNLESSGNFMAWIKDGSPALTWYRSDSYINGDLHNAGFHAYDNFYFHDTLKFHGGASIRNGEGLGFSANLYIHNDTLQNRNVNTNYLRWNSWDAKTHFFHPIDAAGGVWDGSDARIKDEIADTEVSGLEVVRAMEFKQFVRKDSERFHALGLIAQQVQQIAPELVGTDSDGILYIHSEKLAYYALKAVQELAEGLDELFGIAAYSSREPWVDTFTAEEKERTLAVYLRAQRMPNIDKT